MRRKSLFTCTLLVFHEKSILPVARECLKLSICICVGMAFTQQESQGENTVKCFSLWDELFILSTRLKYALP